MREEQGAGLNNSCYSDQIGQIFAELACMLDSDFSDAIWLPDRLTPPFLLTERSLSFTADAGEVWECLRPAPPFSLLPCRFWLLSCDLDSPPASGMGGLPGFLTTSLPFCVKGPREARMLFGSSSEDADNPLNCLRTCIKHCLVNLCGPLSHVLHKGFLQSQSKRPP